MLGMKTLVSQSRCRSDGLDTYMATDSVPTGSGVHRNIQPEKWTHAVFVAHMLEVQRIDEGKENKDISPL